MGTEKSRRERIAELQRIIHEQGPDLNVKEFYGYFALNYGVTFKTFWSYLKALEIANKIHQLPSLKESKTQTGIG